MTGRMGTRALALLAAAALLSPAGATEPGWQLVGRQGLMQVLIVPEAQAADRAAYQAQIDRLCVPMQTCFINFFTNRSGAPLALPLPDEVGAQATARYRYSAKNGVKLFQWACTLRPGEADCF